MSGIRKKARLGPERPSLRGIEFGARRRSTSQMEAETSVDHLSPGNGPRPSPFSPGTMVVVQAGQSTPFTVQPGQRVVLGCGPGADLVISDPSVSPTHALIERSGTGWLVSSLDPANPAWLLDPTGRAQEIDTELGLRQGELLLGACQVLLYSPAP
jgi:hypothetical protein